MWSDVLGPFQNMAGKLNSSQTRAYLVIVRFSHIYININKLKYLNLGETQKKKNELTLGRGSLGTMWYPVGLDPLTRMAVRV